MKTVRQCAATAKATRKPCRRRPILGGTVCPKHGGSAPQVKAKARERLADLIDPDRALREAASLAYSDITELYDEAGHILPMKQWPKHIRAAVSGMETVTGNVDKGDGRSDQVFRLKLWDKPRNLEMLFKHLGLLVERVEHKGGIEITWKSSE
jgi:hypothetical protein